MARQLLDALLGLLAATRALERERLRDDADGQSSHLARDAGHHGRRARAGAAARARRDEHHVGALQQALQVVVVLDCGLAPEIRVRAGAEAASGVGADVDDLVRARLLERLDVRVDGDEVDSLHLRLDHAVYGVDARTAHSDHPENRPA